MKKILILTIVLSFATSCVSGLNGPQKRQYASYKKKGYEIETKNKYVGFFLGILPGGGSFYARRPGIGAVDLLLWPWSVPWDTFNGYNGSEQVNYADTLEFVSRKKEMDLKELTIKFEVGKISHRQYIIEKQKIEDKYSTNL